jgi:hypothetical protein
VGLTQLQKWLGLGAAVIAGEPVIVVNMVAFVTVV